FIYPTWWNSMPAMLKGFLDKVFTGDYAFKYINGIPRGLLKGKAAVFTTSGAPNIFYFLFLRNISLKLVTKFTLKFCGIKSKGYCLGGAHILNEKNKKRIEKMVNCGLKYLN
ncbi:NAD(P)H-dependent oxidoreductase, partial [Candidatus Woesearchaeota archaeon]|nr:NAD(P)H-dependent oxidoreductase [Candidatus Woesearchaeota archaeon]